MIEIDRKIQIQRKGKQARCGLISGNSVYYVPVFCISNFVLRDSTPALSVRPAAYPSLHPSVHHTWLFCGLWPHCSAQKIKWIQIWPLPTRTRLGYPCIRPCSTYFKDEKKIVKNVHLHCHWMNIYIAIFDNFTNDVSGYPYCLVLTRWTWKQSPLPISRKLSSFDLYGIKIFKGTVP